MISKVKNAVNFICKKGQELQINLESIKLTLIKHFLR